MGVNRKTNPDCRGADATPNCFKYIELRVHASDDMNSSWCLYCPQLCLQRGDGWCSLQGTIRPASWAVSGCSAYPASAAASCTAPAAIPAAVSKEMSPVAPSLVPWALHHIRVSSMGMSSCEGGRKTQRSVVLLESKIRKKKSWSGSEPADNMPDVFIHTRNPGELGGSINSMLQEEQLRHRDRNAFVSGFHN